MRLRHTRLLFLLRYFALLCPDEMSNWINSWTFPFQETGTLLNDPQPAPFIPVSNAPSLPPFSHQRRDENGTLQRSRTLLQKCQQWEVDFQFNTQPASSDCLISALPHHLLSPGTQVAVAMLQSCVYQVCLAPALAVVAGCWGESVGDHSTSF